MSISPPDAHGSQDAAASSDSLKTITCTGCPMGCQVLVTQRPTGEWLFSGAQCPRGDIYARQEITNPVRPLTTLIPVRGSKIPLSVKTSQPVPKAHFWALVDQIHQLKLECPIHSGDILVENLLGTGIALLATRTLDQGHRPLVCSEIQSPEAIWPDL